MKKNIGQKIVDIIDRMEPTTRRIFAPIRRYYYKFYKLPLGRRRVIAWAMTLFWFINLFNPLINWVIFLLAWARLRSDDRYKKLVTWFRQARYKRMSEEEINDHIIKKKRSKRRKTRRKFQKRSKEYINDTVDNFRKWIHDAFHEKQKKSV